MIKIEKQMTFGWEEAIRGMRNPMNSWDKSDTDIYDCGVFELNIGPNDLDLMMRLAKAGPIHGKFRRMITVYVDITAPLYWWKEFDTYKVGTVANSCSTMHKIHAKEFTMDDFSVEHVPFDEKFMSSKTQDMCMPYNIFRMWIHTLNMARDAFLETKDKKYWWAMIQMLPSSYNQKRTVMLNYEVLANIYEYRKDHKLDEWREFCKWIETLPYSEIITAGKDTDEYDKGFEAGRAWVDAKIYSAYKALQDGFAGTAQEYLEELLDNHKEAVE